ncbi:MAG: DUF3429 domain-containing protein [Pseudomonadota bacterium]
MDANAAIGRQAAHRTGTVTASAHADSVPAAAGWLGGLGLIPFVTCAAIALLAPPEWATLAAQALGLYGAVILSFLGGIQWGMAIKGGDPSGAIMPSFHRLTLSVLPALVGWFALLLPFTYGFMLLAVAFASVLVVDLQAVRERQAPAWYPRLRWPLTLTAIAALLVGAMA